MNVISGARQTLFTHEGMQYAGFYNGEGRLVLAKRSLTDNRWQTAVTPYSGNVNDAHNSISLAVDAAGYLHVAWDHHNSVLKYARSVTPGSLTLKKHSMLSQDPELDKWQEGSVTYPQFYLLSHGDLIFAYRDGGSGHGNLILNRYNSKQQRWSRLQSNMLDGENARSAYWDLYIDPNGVLHLVWLWRETPDVSTNHDIMYAQSTDEGKSWQRLDGSPYSLPINAATADIIQTVPQNHKLMNPPTVFAGMDSNPLVSSYWADTPQGIPAFHILVANPLSNHWQDMKAPPTSANFSLSGRGTKRPPISRTVLLADTSEDKMQVHLIYRNDSTGGEVIARSTVVSPNPQWQTTILLSDDAGAWEPSFDPVRWQKDHIASLLFQTVGQDDGNDAQSLSIAPSEISVLEWQPGVFKKENP